MYVDEPPKDGNIPDFNISKIDICPFRAYQRSFRLFQSDFSKDIHQRSRLLCFTQNDHTGHAGFKICPFLKWAQYLKEEPLPFTFVIAAVIDGDVEYYDSNDYEQFENLGNPQKTGELLKKVMHP